MKKAREKWLIKGKNGEARAGVSPYKKRTSQKN